MLPRHFWRPFQRIFVFFLYLGAACFPLGATEYFVALDGDDASEGMSPATAFGTIQKGLDVLAPGDVLTIAPGEYAGGVSRKDLGSMELETRIRARIPGTVVLRGDIPAPAFRRLEGTKFTYVAEVSGEVQSVNEADTLVLLQDKVSREEVEFSPGSFYFDREAGKLYISTSDIRPVEEHFYTLSMVDTHGLFLDHPKRVRVEGLVFRGFYSLLPLKDSRPQYVVWGLFLWEPEDCVIRDCSAFLNGGGLLIVSGNGGGNLMEDNVGYGNGSPHNSEGGNIAIFAAHNDTIRNCVGYRSPGTGVRIYGTARGKNVIAGSLGWGNGGPDLGLKGGGLEIDGRVKNSVGLGILPSHHLSHSLVGKKLLYLQENEVSKDNVLLAAENISLRREFADPVNFDFRLQSNSSLRNAAPDGSDRGPFPYEANVYFVRAGGNDENDGLSLRSAWKTAERALRDLKPGDTVYFDDDVHAGALKIRAGLEGEAAINLRARGQSQVVFRGPVTVDSSARVVFERLNFGGPVQVRRSQGLRFDNCSFGAPSVGLTASATMGLRVAHCLFAGQREAGLSLQDCQELTLTANIFNNLLGVAVRVTPGKKSGQEPGATVAFGDYNAYARSDQAWSVDGTIMTLEQLQPGLERYSIAQTAALTDRDGVPGVKNLSNFAARDAKGQNLGFHQEREGQELFMSQPTVHSVTATTANLEWLVSEGTEEVVAWGETPECGKSQKFTIYTSADLHRSFSLTGLKPNTKYYFQIRSINMMVHLKPVEAELVDPHYEIISFTTAAADPAPQVFYVAPDGSDTNSGTDRQNAWRSVSHAAAEAGPGDTVLVAAGTYVEKVRVRNTGEVGKPITFKSLPGERVVFDGDRRRLDNAWVINGKSHITVDGFYFYNHRGEPGGNTSTRLFNVVQSRNILIRRCLMDGRGGGAYPASFLTGWESEKLTISNCVSILAPDGIEASNCPDFRIEHCVFLLTMIANVKLGTPATLESNIFCDSGKFKALQKVQLQQYGEYRNIADRNNCYYFRLPDEERRAFFVIRLPRDWENPYEKISLAELKRRARETDSIVANPEFAVLKSLPIEDRTPFAVDALYSHAANLDFSDLFATNPEVVKRGMGLQPAEFSDRNAPAATSDKP